MPKSKKEDETTKKSSTSKTTKKTTAKKPAVKKAAAKKPAVKKAAAKKPAVKKAAAKKPAVKKTVAKKPAVKKTVAKKPAEVIDTTKSTEISNDGFNWTEFEEGIQTISKKQIDEFEKLINENFVDTYTESVIVGKVVNITEREAIIDINAKSEGVISLNEFRYNPELKIGDSVEVIVDIQEDKTGQLILSHRKARTIKAWERVIEAHAFIVLAFLCDNISCPVLSS